MKNETLFIGRDECATTILDSHGKHFWVKFLKKDNSFRELEGEVRPPKNTENKSPADYNPDLIVVGDRHIFKELVANGFEEEKARDASYRSVPVSRILEFKIDNQLYLVED